MSGIGMTVTGVKEVQKMLEKLERKESAKIVRKETREAQKEVMLPAQRSSAQSVVGGQMGVMIAKNMAVRAMTKMRRGSYGAKVIIKPTDAFVHISQDGTRSYIPNAIEYGHAGPGDAGSKDKVAAPNPFMRTAYEEKRKPTAEYFARKTIKAIEQAAKV